MINKETKIQKLVNFNREDCQVLIDNLGAETFTARINRLVREDNERHHYLSKHN